jgi:hypothetical protein
VAYITVLKMDAGGILVAFGVALVSVGALYKTPFPVQPMKVIGAASIGQALLPMGLGSGAVIGTTLRTGLLRLALAGTVVKTSSIFRRRLSSQFRHVRPGHHLCSLGWFSA